MEKAYGYAGTILKIDLSNEEIKREPIPDDLIKNFIGGLGGNIKLAYDLIGRDIDPLSPDNYIIIGAGPLVGTLAPGIVHTSTITVSPVSGFLGDGRAGGFGQMMKYAGYDHLLITGRAPKPVYLTIFDDEVKIHDASELWGKSVIETIRLIRGLFGEECTFCCIGPGGENLVKYGANLTDELFSFGATNGTGTVMGSKNLKAIVVHGTKGIKVKDQKRFLQLVDEAIASITSNPFIDEWRDRGTIMDLGYYAGFGCFTGKNAREGYPEEKAEEWVDSLIQHRRAKACIGCPVSCKSVLDYSSGKHPGLCIPKSAPIGVAISFSFWCGVEDKEDSMKLAQLCDDYGLDLFGAAHAISLAQELFEVGIINEKDTDGMVLRWDYETVKELLRKITYREGFGNVLAEGASKACDIIGRDAVKYDSTIKGFPQGEDGRAKHMGTTVFGELTAPSGAAFRAVSITQVPGRSPDSLRRYGEKIGMPDDKLDQIFTGEVDGYNTPRFTKWVENYITLLECFGVCHRSIIANTYPLSALSALFSAATGLEMTPSEMVMVGDRVWNLEKTFDALRGQSRKDDKYPHRWLTEPLKLRQVEPEKRHIERLRSLKKLEQLEPLKEEDVNRQLDEYYEEREWDIEKGIPTKEKLISLGLQKAAEELEKPKR